MKEGESKMAALILMKNSHFDRTLRYVNDNHVTDLGRKEEVKGVATFV